MDVWQITMATLRRWYIFAPLLALAGLGAYLVGESVQPEYEVTGTALITPGTVSTEVPDPYGGRNQATTAVAIVLNSPETQARLQAEGLVAAHEVTSRSNSTIMSVQVRADDPQVALAAGYRVFELAQEELSSRQAAVGMPSAAQHRVEMLAEPSLMAVVYDGKLRVQAVVGVLGASVALVTAVLFDDIVGLYRRRRAERRNRRQEPAEPALDTLEVPLTRERERVRA